MLRRGFATVFSLCALLSAGAACAGDQVQQGSGGAPSITTGVTGTTSSGRTTSQTTTHAVSASSTSGAGGAASGAPYPIVLAHGFFGFNDFAGQNYLTYFYQVKDYLAQNGETVYTPAVDPFNDSTYRGHQLETAIEQILADTGAKKVVIVGHSQGGLDARVVAHEHPEYVAAVITIATPHHGTPIADVAMKLLANPNFSGIVDQLVNFIGAPIWDQIGHSTAVSKPLYLFSQPGITAFNATYTDSPGVFYASIAGRSDMNPGGQTCASQKLLPFIESADNDLDPLNAGMWVLKPVLDGNGSEPFVHDGLIRAVDAKWGEFWGCIPGDHLDEIGQIFGASPGVGNPWKYKDFYLGLVKHIRELGY